MSDIKVSIIIPVYNTEQYLKECLDSVINQTLKDIEIICVDDGSTDKSLEVLKEYQQKDSRFVILQQKHKKLGAARNYGMTVARGEYIGFVDSDDWCEFDMFEKLYNRAISTNSDITMCAVKTYNDNNSGEYSKSNTYANLDIFPSEFFDKVFSPTETYDFFFDICAFAYNKLFKKDFLQSKGLKFPENIFIEDRIFLYDAWFKAERISLIRDFCYIYRMYSATSICFSNDFNQLHQFKSLKICKSKLVDNGVYKLLKQDFKKYEKGILLLWYNKLKDKRVKFIYYILMFLTLPSIVLEPFDLLRKEIKLLCMILLYSKKRIALWGASIFLEKFINKYHIKNKNILGIIDKNPKKHGQKLGEYEICPPEKLKEMNVDTVIITILNFSKSNQQNIKNSINNDFEIKDINIRGI